MHGETITLLLLIILGFTTWQGLNQPGVMEKYLFSTDAIRLRRQWIRLVSPAFLHSGWGHYAGNAITLFFFSPFIEGNFGPGSLIFLFFGSVASGHALCLWLHKTQDYRAIGASGGALGVMFAVVLYRPNLLVFIIPGWLYAIGFLLFTVYSLRGGSGVSHEAHLGGALAGILIAFLLPQHPLYKANSALGALLFLLAALGLWYVHMNPGRAPGFLRTRIRGAMAERGQRQRRQESGRVDALLDKVSQQGLHSLSKRERKVLEEASRRRGRNR